MTQRHAMNIKKKYQKVESLGIPGLFYYFNQNTLVNNDNLYNNENNENHDNPLSYFIFSLNTFLNFSTFGATTY